MEKPLDVIHQFHAPEFSFLFFELLLFVTLGISFLAKVSETFHYELLDWQNL